MCLMSSFYVFQDKILKEIESDGYEIVEAKPVQGTGRKVGNQMKGLRYKLNPHPDPRQYLHTKLYKIENQSEKQKARDKLADLKKKRIAKSVEKVDRAMPMFGQGKSLIHPKYTPGYKTEEFTSNGKAPSNVTQAELEFFAQEKNLALEREKLRRESSPQVSNNTKVCCFSLLSMCMISSKLQYLITCTFLYHTMLYI